MPRCGEAKCCSVPFSVSDEAECGEMIRTVLPVLVFGTRGRSALLLAEKLSQSQTFIACPSYNAHLYLFGESELPACLRKHC